MSGRAKTVYILYVNLTGVSPSVQNYHNIQYLPYMFTQFR